METEIRHSLPSEEKKDRESIFRVLEALPDPFFVKDSELRTVYVNQAYLDISRVERHRIIGRTDADYLPPEVAAFCRQQDQNVLSSGQPLISEESFDGENGPRQISVKKVRVHFPDGKNYIVGTIRDLTDVRKTERQLRDIVEMIEETIWSMEADTLKTLYMSQSAEKMYGRPLAELYRAETWKDIMHVDDASKVLSSCAQVRNGENSEVEFRIHHPALGERVIHLKSHPVRDHLGKVQRIEGIATDITERLNAQKEIANHQQKLVAASKMNALGELASGIGHEINTPLTGIMSKVSRLEMMIRNDSLDRERALRFCADANLLVQKVADIIQGLKDLSKNHTGEEMIDFDPLTSLNQALSLTRARFSNQGVHLKLENHLPPGQLAHGVPTYLFQSIVNLLNNAFDALVSQGEQSGQEKTVRIRLEKTDSEILLSVTDNGPGVAASILPQIFDPFVTTKTNTDGTGLGLSISRRLMRQTGGDLIHDASSKQTTFVIFMPIARS